jgi:hypothetical protein
MGSFQEKTNMETALVTGESVRKKVTRRLTYQLAFLILGGMAILAAVLAVRLVRPAAAG